jgi:hypothetical protein
MDNPRFAEVTTIKDLIDELHAKNTVWMLIIGDEAWSAAAIAKAKEQVTDCLQRKVIWIRNRNLLTAPQLEILLGGSSNAVGFAVAMNGGVACRLDQAAIQRGSKIGDALADAETYSGEGYSYDAWLS